MTVPLCTGLLDMIFQPKSVQLYHTPLHRLWRSQKIRNPPPRSPLRGFLFTDVMNSRFKVVITDFIAGALEPEHRILGDMATITAIDSHSEQDLVGKIEDADAVMIYHNIGLSRFTIERLKHCKLIVRCGVGYDNVDYRLARERGIPVANVPDYGTEEVADSAIGLTLALTRGINQINSLLRGDTAVSWMYTHFAPLYRLRGRVFAIVGLGRIGTAAGLRTKRSAWMFASTIP